MTSKQRAYLKSLAMTQEPILQIGKSSLTPEFTASVDEALEARELIKISVLKNCMDDPRALADVAGGPDEIPGGSGDRKENRSLPGRKGKPEKNRIAAG